MKNIRVFYLKNFSFLEVKFSIYLNRRVFVMIAISNKWLFSKHTKNKKTSVYNIHDCIFFPDKNRCLYIYSPVNPLGSCQASKDSIHIQHWPRIDSRVCRLICLHCLHMPRPLFFMTWQYFFTNFCKKYHWFALYICMKNGNYYCEYLKTLSWQDMSKVQINN